MMSPFTKNVSYRPAVVVPERIRQISDAYTYELRENATLYAIKRQEEEEKKKAKRIKEMSDQFEENGKKKEAAEREAEEARRAEKLIEWTTGRRTRRAENKAERAATRAATRAAATINSSSYEESIGGFRHKKPSVPQSKEILGKQRRIYKVAGSRKEHIKYKGQLIPVSDYKKLFKK